jgi:hypothetical protein
VANSPAPAPSRFAARLKAALPAPALAVAGSLGWALTMASSAALAGLMRSRAFGGNLETVIAVFGIGGLAGFVPALTAYRLFGRQKSRSQRFSLMFLALTLATVACTSLTFTLILRSYYAQWHDDFPSLHWFEEQFFTTASSTYQFAVLGLRSFLPLGLPALFFAAWLMSKKPV